MLDSMGLAKLDLQLLHCAFCKSSMGKQNRQSQGYSEQTGSLGVGGKVGEVSERD